MENFYGTIAGLKSVSHALYDIFKEKSFRVSFYKDLSTKNTVFQGFWFGTGTSFDPRNLL